VGILTVITLVPGGRELHDEGNHVRLRERGRHTQQLTGSAVGIVTLLGWLPDTFMSTMFGGCCDKHGNGGYHYIFYYLIAMCALCIVTSLLIIKVKKNAAAA
jgi:sugar phosphate permease